MMLKRATEEELEERLFWQEGKLGNLEKVTVEQFAEEGKERT